MTDTKPEMKMFPLGDILTIITGRMVTPNGMGAIYEILDYMTGENLFTHQLPRASGQCEPILKEFYPGLAKVEVPSGDNIPEGAGEEFWMSWLQKQIDTFGKELPVPKLKGHSPFDPVTELTDMLNKAGNHAPIIIVTPENAAEVTKALIEDE